MLPIQTLISIACLIANKGPMDTKAIESQVSQEDSAKIQSIIDSNACLPDNMEKLLQDTKNKMDRGELKEMSAHGEPTRDCGY